MEPIPDAATIAAVIRELANGWDSATLGRRRRFEPGTALELDHSDYADRPSLAEHLATKPADLAVLTCASVIQVARSGAALYAVSDQWALTMGHLPILRSVLEGAGQVAWLLVGDAPLTALLPTEPEAREARVKRGAVLWGDCLRQSLRDQRRTGDEGLVNRATEQLKDWERVVREGFPTLLISKDRWVIDDIRVPSFTEAADLGLTLACLPKEQDFSLYPWLSAASHHRLYPLLERLQSGTVEDQPALRVSPDPLETSGAGYLLAWAVYRTFEATFAYHGWSTEPLSDALVRAVPAEQLQPPGEPSSYPP